MHQEQFPLDEDTDFHMQLPKEENTSRTYLRKGKTLILLYR